MHWIISGIGLPALRIQANSFDEAIKQARTVDIRYSGGYVDDSTHPETED